MGAEVFSLPTRVPRLCCDQKAAPGSPEPGRTRSGCGRQDLFSKLKTDAAPAAFQAKKKGISGLSDPEKWGQRARGGWEFNGKERNTWAAHLGAASSAQPGPRTSRGMEICLDLIIVVFPEILFDFIF